MTWEHSSHSAMCEEPSETRLCWQNASYLKKKKCIYRKVLEGIIQLYFWESIFYFNILIYFLKFPQSIISFHNQEKSYIILNYYALKWRKERGL